MSRILFIDVETSPLLSYVWEAWEANSLHIEKQREIICVAYKWEGGKVHVFGLDKNKPRAIAKRLRRLLDECDVAVAQNGNAFDFKIINTFIIKHGLPPPSPYKTVDTLLIARRHFKFASNKLNDLGEYLGVGKKVETGGFKLWLSCLRKDREAWRKMKKYNKVDVILLEKVYNKLRGWAKSPILRDGFVCPVCGSAHVHLSGWKIYKTYKAQRFQCRNCGAWRESSLKVKFQKKDYLK